MMVKLQYFSLGFLLLSNLHSAALDIQPLEPLDEEFLEFIANMSEVDGEVVDSLDMLELAENDMTSTHIEDTLNRVKTPDKSKELKIENSLVGEKKL
jgi:hypothetical protein